MTQSKPRAKPTYGTSKGDESVSYFDEAKRFQEAIQSDVVRQTSAGSESLALELADSAHAHATDFFEAVGRSLKTDCESGCSFCCHQPATVFPFEAIQIARTLQNTRSREELEALKLAMKNRVQNFTGASVRKNVNNKTACPLLQADRCSVYENRPLTCRMAHSFSAKRCRLAFQKDRNKISLPISLELQTGIGGIIEGVYEGLPQKRLDGNLYELSSAVLAALEQPEATQRWAQGDFSVFGKCIKDDT